MIPSLPTLLCRVLRAVETKNMMFQISYGCLIGMTSRREVLLLCMKEWVSTIQIRLVG